MPTDALLSTAHSFLAQRITLARRRANVSYLPTFAAKNREALVAYSETGRVHGPALATYVVTHHTSDGTPTCDQCMNSLDGLGLTFVPAPQLTVTTAFHQPAPELVRHLAAEMAALSLLAMGADVRLSHVPLVGTELGTCDTGLAHGPSLPTAMTLNDWVYRYGTVPSYSGPYASRSGFRVDPWYWPTQRRLLNPADAPSSTNREGAL